MRAAFNKHVDAFLIAVQFFTTIPIRFKTYPATPTQSIAPLYYPLVGVMIGMMLFAAASYLHTHTLLTSAIVVTLWAVITGGLHLDGVADSADGWMAGIGQREKTLAVMKDPLVGASGVLTLVLVLLLKFAAVVHLLEAGALFVLLLAPLVARTAALLLLATTPYVSPTGIASHTANQLPTRVATAVCGLILVMLISISPSVAILIGLSFWWLRRAMLRRLGGMTGDTAGALIEIIEVLFLVYFSVI